MTPKAKATKAKINKWDYIRQKSLCKTEQTSNNTKSQPPEWETIFVNHIFDKQSISKIYKELIQHNSKKESNLKMSRGSEQIDIQMANRYTKRCTTSLITAAAKSLQSCPTLCDPIDGSPPGSPVPGILKARTLEWVAISFSNVWKWKVKVKLLSFVQLVATWWTAAYQAPPSMGFSRQEVWSGSLEKYKSQAALKYHLTPVKLDVLLSKRQIIISVG